MKQCHTKGCENSGELCMLLPLLGERDGVRASVSSDLIFGAGGSYYLHSVGGRGPAERCTRKVWRQ